MPTFPPFLEPGDKIAIVATARKISREELNSFINLAGSKQLEVVFTPRLFETDHQYAGTDSCRAEDIQYWLDNRKVKAIACARGGYGTARIIDRLDFSGFVQSPKWLVGFSDFTVIHSYVNSVLEIPALHAGMPVFFKEHGNKEVERSFNAMLEFLCGNISDYDLPAHPLNRPGNCKGELVGGNLSVIYSMMGSSSELMTDNKILFLEDLDEYLYHIDRMMVALKRAGKLRHLKGMIVGNMNNMHDSKIPFGKNPEEIIREHTDNLDIPVYFGFDAGHMPLNLPLILGAEIEIDNNCLIFGNSVS